MAAQFARAPHRGVMAGPTTSAPNAALLIDFDNVTMGIRSDLSKELKNLLNSDIIKGKVAVQRAYADWRRYPQYIVPLAEASVDLIFAPAYGSSKKNATDIRLAIDALELVFTRPEIGTFILLSGDSDFSSLVLKLKEYGKYVIGVGIRESASDLLVQNCDEYYSYSVLSGLTKEGDAVGERPDPWTLVRDAVRQMAEHSDVMRSDRLKQVMLELDPNFNEKDLGYSKFSKFLSDAVARGCLSLRKLENGQWEVSPPVEATAETQAPESPKSEGERESRGSREDGRRSRGRSRDRDSASSRRDDAVAQDEARKESVTEARVVVPAVAEAAPEGQPAAEAAPSTDIDSTRPAGDTLAAAYDLLRRAVTSVAGASGGAARDSDVKRRMLELQPGWDESALGFSKFSRFLRQAHDAEVIDLHRTGNGTYEMRVGSGRPTADAASEPRDRRDARVSQAAKAKDRRPMAERRNASKAEVEARIPAEVEAPSAETTVTASEKPQAEEKGAPTEEAAKAPAASSPKGSGVTLRSVTSDTQAVTSPAAGRPRLGLGIGFRRGTIGRTVLSGPPPLLPGQAVRLSELSNGKAEPSKSTEPAAQGSTAPVTAEPVSAAPAVDQAAESKSGRSRSRSRSKEAAKSAKTEKADLPELAGLPRQPDEVLAYLSTRYKGVGKKTAEALVEAFGVDGVFRALHQEPDRVREVVGRRRAEILISAWNADLEQRRVEAAALVAEASPAAVESTRGSESEAAAEDAAVKAQSRRSGARRGRGSTKKAEAEAEATVTPAVEAPEAKAPAESVSSTEAAADVAVEDSAQKKTGGRSRGRRGGRKRSKSKVNAGES